MLLIKSFGFNWSQRFFFSDVIPSILLRLRLKDAGFFGRRGTSNFPASHSDAVEAILRWKCLSGIESITGLCSKRWDSGGLWCFCGVICENGVIRLDSSGGGWKIFLFMKTEGDTSPREDSGPPNRAINVTREKKTVFALFILCIIYLFKPQIIQI